MTDKCNKPFLAKETIDKRSKCKTVKIINKLDLQKLLKKNK